MCFKRPVLLQPKSVEEIVAEKSVGMTDAQKAEYWYELTQSVFSLLGKVEVGLIDISVQEWLAVAIAQYPTLIDVKFADTRFRTVSLDELQKILSRDWTNYVPFDTLVYNCDKYANELYAHLCLFYKINAIVPVWGDTDRGYHGFNLAVVMNSGQLISRLIEPQSDAIFIEQGPLGKYIPRSVAEELCIKKLN